MRNQKLDRIRAILALYLVLFPGLYAMMVPFVTFAGAGEVYIAPLSTGIVAAGLSIWGMIGFIRYSRWKYRFLIFFAAIPILLATFEGGSRLLRILFD